MFSGSILLLLLLCCTTPAARAQNLLRSKPQTNDISVLANSNFIPVEIPGLGTNSTHLISASNLLESMKLFPGWPSGLGTLTTIKTNGANVSTTAASVSFIEGTNVILRATNTAGAVTVQINAAGGSGSGDVSTAQLLYVSNQVQTASNSLVTQIAAKSNFVVSAHGTANFTNGINIGAATRYKIAADSGLFYIYDEVSGEAPISIDDDNQIVSLTDGLNVQGSISATATNFAAQVKLTGGQGNRSLLRTDDATNVVAASVSTNGLTFATNGTLFNKALLFGADGLEWWDDFDRDSTNGPGISPSGHAWGHASAGSSAALTNWVYTEGGLFKAPTNAINAAAYWGVQNQNTNSVWTRFLATYQYKSWPDANGWEDGLGFIICTNLNFVSGTWLHCGFNRSGFYIQKEFGTKILEHNYPGGSLQLDTLHQFEINLVSNNIIVSVNGNTFIANDSEIGSKYTPGPGRAIVIVEHNHQLTNLVAQYRGEWGSVGAGRTKPELVAQYARDQVIITNGALHSLTSSNVIAKNLHLNGGQTASSLLRLTSGTNLGTVTIGSGLTFDGTELAATGGGAGEANVNGEVSVTNATRIGLVNGKAGVTNLLRSVQGGNGIVLTNQGTNVMFAVDPAVVPSHPQLVTASNAVVTQLVANDTTTSNSLLAQFVANDTTTSNSLRSEFISNDTTTSNGVVTFALARGTNFPPVINLLGGTNLAVTGGVRKAVTLTTNASFALNLEGTPANGFTAHIGISNYSSSTIFATTYVNSAVSSVYLPSVASNVSVFPVAANSIRLLELRADTNFNLGTVRWMVIDDAAKEFEIVWGYGTEAATNGAFVTNGLSAALRGLHANTATTVTNENSPAIQIAAGVLGFTPNGPLSNLVASGINIQPNNVVSNIGGLKHLIWTNYVQTVSNFVFSFNTNHVELKNQTNVVFTNIVEEATGVASSLEIHIHNTTGVTMGLVWPAYGAQHGYFLQTNANNPIITTTTLSAGQHGIAAIKCFGTNLFATFTTWP